MADAWVTIAKPRLRWPRTVRQLRARIRQRAANRRPFWYGFATCGCLVAWMIAEGDHPPDHAGAVDLAPVVPVVWVRGSQRSVPTTKLWHPLLQRRINMSPDACRRDEPVSLVRTDRVWIPAR